MRASQTLIATVRELPKEAELMSHKYMLKAGLIHKLASGVYTWLPLGLKVLQKVEAIVRTNMSKAGASELLLPTILPAELLQETHRWEKFGPELLKIKDRNGREFCYGPTHEEPIVDMVRNSVKSYKQLPLNLYQIQTKFRDEIRPRFGLMRAREFLMKDAYSFHLSEECLDKTYKKMYKTYIDILSEIGLEFRVVDADSGSIGGNASNEFQVLADAGEDVVCYCEDSDYAANIELATYLDEECCIDESRYLPSEKISTPNIKTIEELSKFMDCDAKNIIKTIVIKNTEDKFIALALRGDHSLNDIKVAKLSQIGENFKFATNDEIRNIYNAGVGSIGVLCSPIEVIVDKTALHLENFICGANEDDFHIKNTNWSQLNNYTTADIRNVVEGDKSPDGNGILKFTNGIEVGHIFKLGAVYTDAMKTGVINKDGKFQNITMGCYGFGISRVVAATIEQSHDERGIIWPEAIAPYKVAILPINMNKSKGVQDLAESLYRSLTAQGVEVILDDRCARPGVMFADADLIGIPHHIIISDRLLKENLVEYKNRATGEKLELTVTAVIDRVV